MHTDLTKPAIPPEGPLPVEAAGGSTPLGDGRGREQILATQRLESLGRMAGGVAHDFNNVLGVILGYVELAKMSGVPPPVERHLESALGTIGRARMLADRLMEFAGGGVRDEADTDLNLAVAEVRALLEETADRRVAFDVQLANDTPWTSVPHRYLTQVVMNLCVNACDALAASGGRVQVFTGRRIIEPGHATLAPGTYAELRVRDDGLGIPARIRERIFEPYFSTRQGASGLGLWAVREIVEDAGGAVLLESADPGSCFRVCIPAAQGTNHQIEEARADTEVRGRGRRVLIVDDEPGVRSVTRVFLEDAGFVVGEAGTGAAGLLMLDQPDERFDLVLLDLHLADVPGEQMAEWIRALADPPEIIVISGVPASQSVPGVPHLAKPFLRRGLLEAVDSALADA